MKQKKTEQRIRTRQRNATNTFALIGIAKFISGEPVIVRSIVNEFDNTLQSIEVLYAVNAKKNQLGACPQAFPQKRTTLLVLLSVYLIYLIMSISIRVIDFDKNKRNDLSVIAQTTSLGNITESFLNYNLSQFKKEINRFKQNNNIQYQDREGIKTVKYIQITSRTG